MTKKELKLALLDIAGEKSEDRDEISYNLADFCVAFATGDKLEIEKIIKRVIAHYSADDKIEIV
jgi:hypothetical protein